MILCLLATVAVSMIIVGASVTSANAQADNSTPASRAAYSVWVDVTAFPADQQVTAIQETAQVLERRLYLYGDSAPSVLIDGDDDILVDVPADWSPERVAELLARTGVLDFREEQGTTETPEWVPATAQGLDGAERPLTGAHFDHVSLQVDQSTQRPSIAFWLDDEGSAMMAEITGRMIGRRLGVFLDDEPLMTPTVVSAIRTGQGLISGNFSTEEATLMVALLNAGPLPAPVQVELQ